MLRKKLPQIVEKMCAHLPIGAQKIFIEAFNNARHQYESPKKRMLVRSQEERAHRIAWLVVKKRYEKRIDGRWIRK